MVELLKELRVALPGVQILFAFLLTVPSPGFGPLTSFQNDVYYWTLIATALSAACLIAPSAAHRLRFHQGDRIWVIESANRLTIIGLGFLAAAICGPCSCHRLLFNGPRWIFSGALPLLIVGLWFVRPLTRTAAGASSGPDPRP